MQHICAVIYIKENKMVSAQVQKRKSSNVNDSDRKRRKKRSTVDNAKVADWWRKIPNFLDDTGTSDFTILVANSRIPVHKLILSLHSDVFKEMFSAESKEALFKELNITDFSFQGVRSFIRLLYDPTITRVKNPSEVFELAEKYKVD